jgi:hypothetical protein
MWNIPVSLYPITFPEVYVVISICGMVKVHTFGLPTIKFHTFEYLYRSCDRLCGCIMFPVMYELNVYVM